MERNEQTSRLKKNMVGVLFAFFAFIFIMWFVSHQIDWYLLPEVRIGTSVSGSVGYQSQAIVYPVVKTTDSAIYPMELIVEDWLVEEGQRVMKNQAIARVNFTLYQLHKESGVTERERELYQLSVDEEGLLRSPVKGFLVERSVEAGKKIAPNTPIFRYASDDVPLILRWEKPEYYADRFTRESNIQCSFPVTMELTRSTQIVSQGISVSRLVKVEDGNILFIADFKPEEGEVDLNTRVSLLMDSSGQRHERTVPKSAVHSAMSVVGESKQVFVLKMSKDPSKGVVYAYPVRVLSESDTMYAIEGSSEIGLPQDALIVMSTTKPLRDGGQVRIQIQQ